MCDGVRETLCTRCAHREVCAYKDTYLQYLKGFEDFHNGYLDDASFIRKDDPKCKFFKKKVDVYPRFVEDVRGDI